MLFRSEKPDDLIIILGVSFVSYFVLAPIQDCIAKKLKSPSLRASAIDSWLAAAMSSGVLITTCIYRQVGTSVWFLDHSVAIFIGLLSLIYGLSLVMHITLNGKNGNGKLC